MSRSPLEALILAFDHQLRILTSPAEVERTRPSPVSDYPETPLTTFEKKNTAGLMRINHAGEVCAQGLYMGQALTARLESVRTQMEQAAAEEKDHLAWCEERLEELGARPSRFNPLWLMGSTMIGALAGLAGDRWSLGFLAETEHQVATHLEGHRTRLAPDDRKTRHLLECMQYDESQHAQLAQQAGAAPLPLPIRWLMRACSKIMTSVSYWV